jgi:hypothetical protein
VFLPKKKIETGRDPASTSIDAYIVLLIIQMYHKTFFTTYYILLIAKTLDKDKPSKESY